MKHLLIALLVLLAGCPRQTRKTLVPDVPQHGNSTARSRFLEAKAKFLRDGGHALEFKKIVEDFPNDPIVPFAELYAGIAALKGRDFGEAEKQLAHVIQTNTDPGLTTRAELFLGITKNYQGDTATARRLLPKAERAIENDDERTEYLAALAYATAAGERPLASLAIFDELYGRVTPAERALIVARCEEVVLAADRGALERLVDELGDRKGPGLAAAGSRLVAIYARAGETARAAKLREQIAGVRAAMGMSRSIGDAEVGAAPAGGSSGNPNLIGAVVPLGSKKSNRVAEQAVAGLGLAAGAPDGRGVVAIETRVGIDKTSSAEAVDALARANVVAIVGPIDNASVDGASSRAENLGVPLISLATTADQRATGRFIFHIRHSPENRARALAQRALGKGIKTFAILAPETAYGKGISAAFADAVKKGGGTVVTTVTYAADAKSFTDKVKLKSDWEAVFIADEAKRVGLIVPALAAAGHISRPLPLPKKLRSGRPILLLSTAEGLDASYLADAGRHSEGALFAPGFFPDAADAAAKPFIDRFVAAYGRQPEATEAYAYDAASLAAAAASGGRSGLAASLASNQLQGVTGMIRFDERHRRADPGVIYSIAQETGGAFAIRVAK